MLETSRKLEEEYLLAAVTDCSGRTECSMQYGCFPVCGGMHCSVLLPMVLNIAGNAQQGLTLHRLLELPVWKKSEPLKQW